jgi:divalent metal cation (Fe/Co/Zn/Cd) transporter
LFLEWAVSFYLSSLLITILISYKSLPNYPSLSALSSVQHIVLLGSFSNLFLAASKFFAGWHYDSNALTAEGWHSIADLAMDTVTAFTVFLSSQFSSKNIPGSRYIEDFGSLVISSIVCFGGFRTLWQSCSDLNTLVPGVNHQLPGVGALWIPLLTIITKETIYTIS